MSAPYRIHRNVLGTCDDGECNDSALFAWVTTEGERWYCTAHSPGPISVAHDPPLRTHLDWPDR